MFKTKKTRWVEKGEKILLPLSGFLTVGAILNLLAGKALMLNLVILVLGINYFAELAHRKFPSQLTRGIKIGAGIPLIGLLIYWLWWAAQ